MAMTKNNEDKSARSIIWSKEYTDYHNLLFENSLLQHILVLHALHSNRILFENIYGIRAKGKRGPYLFESKENRESEYKALKKKRKKNLKRLYYYRKRLAALEKA